VAGIMLEFELKIRVPSLDPVRKRLMENDARFCGSEHEHDIYFNAPHRDFGVTDESIRVRYSNTTTVVTYKGAKIKTYGLKAREELNVVIDSGEVFEQMLDRLGFTRAAEVNKWRENYRLSDAGIMLDEVEDLGTFVEIEIMSDNEISDTAARIEEIAKKIGVSGEPILASYLELLLTKRSEVRS
jgi:adenylate cyclase class 2